MNKLELITALAVISDSEVIKVGNLDITGVEVVEIGKIISANILTGDATIAALEQDVARKSAEVERLSAEVAARQLALDAAAAEKAEAERLLDEAKPPVVVDVE